MAIFYFRRIDKGLNEIGAEEIENIEYQLLIDDSYFFMNQ